METPFFRLGSWCTEHIRSVHDMHWDTTGYLFKVTIYSAHISSNESHFLPADHIRSVKLGMVCFHILWSLLNVLAHHLWVQIWKSTLFFNKTSFTWILARFGLWPPLDTARFELGLQFDLKAAKKFQQIIESWSFMQSSRN